MLHFKRLFNFPGPKDLGISDSNYAMPSRYFPNHDGEVSWEDYYECIKQIYPIRFFLSCTLPDFIRYTYLDLIGYRLKNVYYWLRNHTTHRYHILDLRQPAKKSEPDYYRHGWCDTDYKILYALMNLLDQYVRNELLNSYLPTEEECKSDPYPPLLQEQRDRKLEVLAIHTWWTVERKKDLREYNDLLSAWHDAAYSKKGKLYRNSIEAEGPRDKLNAKEAANDEKETEMLIRLIKVRKSLWT
jgi:hypothetical protein